MINYDLPYGRCASTIQRRSHRPHRLQARATNLGLFFPAERLDGCWHWRNVLRKLALADAADRCRRILPGRGPGHEVNLADDQVVDEFEKLLDASGSG